MTNATTIPAPGADFKLAPQGTWPAVCTRIVDLGTQHNPRFDNYAHKIMIVWELHDEECMTDGDDPKPMTIAGFYTWSMSTKANLRKMLEAWRGKAFSEADFGKFDIANLLGKACLVQVTHNKDGDKTYTNVTSVMKLPKGIKTPTAEGETQLLWLNADIFDQELFDRLSDKMQDKIKKSPEYQEMVGDLPEGEFGPDDKGDGPGHKTEELEEEEIPF